jgi:hypothetical protein
MLNVVIFCRKLEKLAGSKAQNIWGAQTWYWVVRKNIDWPSRPTLKGLFTQIVSYDKKD